MDSTFIRLSLHELDKPGSSSYEEVIWEIDRAIDYARRNNMYLSLSLLHDSSAIEISKSCGLEISNNWKDFYENNCVKESIKNKINYVLNHVNPYNGVRWKDDSSISMMTVFTEAPYPIYGTIGEIGLSEDEKQAYANFMIDIIDYTKSVDSDLLVSDGAIVNWWWDFWPQNYEYNGKELREAIDYVTAHYYIEIGLTYDPLTTQMVYYIDESEVMEDIDNIINLNGFYDDVLLNKPLLLEEIGFDYRGNFTYQPNNYLDPKGEELFEDINLKAKEKNIPIFYWDSAKYRYAVYVWDIRSPSISGNYEFCILLNRRAQENSFLYFCIFDARSQLPPTISFETTPLIAQQIKDDFPKLSPENAGLISRIFKSIADLFR